MPELHPAQHVRAGAQDEVRAGVDRRVGERDHIAPVLAEVVLAAGAHVLGADPLGSGMHVHDDQIGLVGRLAHQRGHTGQVERVVGPVVWREPKDRDADRADVLDRDRARRPRVTIPTRRSAAAVFA